ncbi:MAG: CPBP family intramembrane metalloprotease [Acidobacteria bacterium]|nr:CPBP family intramembrane metalloprotease [Acidobacteriota bacterium]
MPERNLSEKSPGLGRKIVMFPLVRIIIAIFFVLLVVALISAILKPLGHSLFPGAKQPIAWISVMMIFSTVMVTLAYLAYVRIVERRVVSEMELKPALSELRIGYISGAAMMTVSIGIIWLLGYYQVTEINGATVLIVPFFTTIFIAFFEEIVFRGIIFRIINESLGSWVAVVVSALIFGFAHGLNPNATLFSSVAIALEAGVLLSAVYLYTNRLWMVIGIHISWNFFQGAVLGVNVSGTTAKGLLQAKLEGPELLTGGPFGAEASIITISICLVVGLVFLFLAHRKGNFQKPFWCKKKESAMPDELSVPVGQEGGQQGRMHGE